ncbi:phosphatase methylesterase 1 protein [Rutstroemia sp. NJR-2017a BBW]|nr:phosphatase methylesterase 1 protein [Rutstroemia sp. NJR-2017a BBW]
MSDLQRAFIKPKLPSFPPSDFNEADEEEGTDAAPELPDIPIDDDSSSASSASSTGTVIPSSNQKLFARPQGLVILSCVGSQTNEGWTRYLGRHHKTDSNTITYHTYLTSPAGVSAPLFVMHHGAGSSGLSFAVLTEEIRRKSPNSGMLSVDARGHGSTTINPSPDTLDLSLETLSSDLLNVIEATKVHMGWESLPPLILVGHSLGGAVVTDVAKSGKLGNSVLGYAVLDVVEGSAMDALQSMQTYLSTRPLGFPSLESGIEWHIRSRTIRNSLSARTSVPALLIHNEEGGSRPWVWRTNLGATQPFWEGWFVGLSKKFLEARGGKLLLLAGTDRLDKELTIGQMQGNIMRISTRVFPEAGHFIHEDLPEKTAMVLVDFYRRNDRSALVLPPKVSDLLKAGKRV